MISAANAALLPRMTEEEFDAWSGEDTRAEFVDGKVILMSPVSVSHYEIGKLLLTLLNLYLEARPVGRVLGPEIEVRLRTGLRRVPDLLFLADSHGDRLQETRLEGAPDAVFEIVSPDSVARDWRDKYLEYQQAGVPEYWVIDPAQRQVHLYALADGAYRQVEEVDGKLLSVAIEGFWIRPQWLWREPLPKVLDCLRELDVL